LGNWQDGNGMPEIDIERKIEKYYGRIDRLLSDEDRELLDSILDGIEKYFIDPAKNSPVKAVEFASWLDPEPIVDLLRTSYPYFEYIKDRFGVRIRFFAYFMLSKKKNLWQAYHSLSEEGFMKLGFSKIPNYELLREFTFERIGIEQLPLVLCWVVGTLKLLLQKKKIQLGEKTFQDATDTRSLKHDKEAKYSGYYKHSGYKLDSTIDADLDIPLYYSPMEITTDEGGNLIPSQEHLAFLDINEEERTVDDKYATFANIAHSEINGTSLYYKIASNWVFSKKGEEKAIKKLYQKYHRDDDFIVNPDLDFMLRYLYKKGEVEPVGAFYRNQRMKQAEEDPEGYKKICDKRGVHMEGHFGRVKLTTILDDHPGRRGWKQFLLRAGMTMLSLVFAALIRVQNGVFEHFTNVTYIV